MNDRRKKLVDMAFDKLDKTDDGVVTLEDLKGVYTVTNHPKYQSGEMTEEDILNTIIKKFEHNTSVDGKVRGRPLLLLLLSWRGKGAVRKGS